MNGTETGALPLDMVTAREPSPTRPIGARALIALAALAAACVPNPPGVRGVAGAAPAPYALFGPPPPRAAHPHPNQPRPAPRPGLAPQDHVVAPPDAVRSSLRDTSAT